MNFLKIQSFNIKTKIQVYYIFNLNSLLFSLRYILKAVFQAAWIKKNGQRLNSIEWRNLAKNVENFM